MFDYEIKRYNMANVCSFSKAKEPFGELGNMTSGFSFDLMDIRIVSTETLYQCMRFTFCPGIQREILMQKGGMGAKMVAKKYRNSHTRSDWPDIQVAVMRWCLQLKLAHNPYRLGSVLIDTKDRPIVEYSKRDNFWGAQPEYDELVGANVLGQLWSEIRDDFVADLDNNTENFRTVRMPNVQNFQLLGEYIAHQTI